MPLRRRRVGTRVRRKIRRIELWPALKIAFLFHLAAYAVTMVTLVVAWSLLSRAGFVEKISSFLVDIGFTDGLTLTGPVLARGAALVGAAFVIHNTVVTFLMVLLYNLFSSLFGGLIVSVIEERLPSGAIGDGPTLNGRSPSTSKPSSKERSRSKPLLKKRSPQSLLGSRVPELAADAKPNARLGVPLPVSDEVEDRWLDELEVDELEVDELEVGDEPGN